VSDKYKKKIELMVRKPDRGDEAQEGLSPCPFCHLPGPETQLQCVSCQSIIPCDIVTGEGPRNSKTNDNVHMGAAAGRGTSSQSMQPLTR